MKDNPIVEMYLKKFGNTERGRAKTQDMINYLAKEEFFIEAISTEVGQHIMKSHIDLADEAFDRFRSSLPTNEDINKLNTKTIIALAEYNAHISIIRRVSERIKKFNDNKPI